MIKIGQSYFYSKDKKIHQVFQNLAITGQIQSDERIKEANNSIVTP